MHVSDDAMRRDLMSPLVWLMPIIVVTIVAAAWTAWASRPKRPADMFDSMQAHRRFVAALAKTQQADPKPDRERP